jgi:hypothetical protein
MQPIYYLPGIYREQLVAGEVLSPAVLRQRGLEQTFADVRAGEFIVTDILRGGPDQKTGCILAYTTAGDGKLPALSGYEPEHQTWKPIDDGSRVWLGLAKDAPPTAAELRRRKQYSGYWVETDAGNYLVPIVRRQDASTELPRDCYFDGGELRETIKTAYQEYWQASAEVADWFFADGWAQFTKARGLTLAVQALSLNYRLGQAEQAALRIIDTESLLTVLAYSVDVPGAKRLIAEKKSA